MNWCVFFGGGAVITKYHQLGGLHNANGLSGILEARCPSWFGLVGVVSFRGLLRPPTAPGGQLAIFGLPWLREA